MKKTKTTKPAKETVCPTCGTCPTCGGKQPVVVMPAAPCPLPHYPQPVVIPDWTWRPAIGPYYYTNGTATMTYC